MRVIYKYELSVDSEQVVNIPIDATILDIQIQNGRITMWALCNVSNAEHPVTIYIYGTGNRIPDIRQKYLATVQLNGFVWHLFKAE